VISGICRCEVKYSLLWNVKQRRFQGVIYLLPAYANSLYKYLTEKLLVTQLIKRFRKLYGKKKFNLLSTQLNLICHLLALLEAHLILYFSKITVKFPLSHNQGAHVPNNINRLYTKPSLFVKIHLVLLSLLWRGLQTCLFSTSILTIISINYPYITYSRHSYFLHISSSMILSIYGYFMTLFLQCNISF